MFASDCLDRCHPLFSFVLKIRPKLAALQLFCKSKNLKRNSKECFGTDPPSARVVGVWGGGVVLLLVRDIDCRARDSPITPQRVSVSQS